MTVDIGGVPRAFGRKVEHDPRSRSYGIVVNPAAKPKTILWEHTAPVLDQGSVGSCTGNALAQCINTESFTRPAGYLTEDDAVALYSRATVLDDFPGDYPPDDTGSSGLAVAKAGVEHGYLAAYSHAFGLPQALHALQGGPVIVGTVWLAGMESPDSKGFLPVTGDEQGGHEYLVLGCDVEGEYITMLNSWSDSWGDHGRAKIGFKDFDALLKNQGDVVAPQPK